MAGCAFDVRLPGECMTCRQKEACHACAAMCVSETGHFNGKPEYVCRMMKETVRLLQGGGGLFPDLVGVVRCLF